MKKHLIAAAVAATVAVPAMAQVTVYGNLGYVYDVLDTKAGREDTSVTAGRATGLGTPVLGLRGSEDLGGGLKASFDMQGQYDTMNGAMSGTTFFNRQSWIGLSGGFGTIKVGRTDTALKDLDGYGESGANLFDNDSVIALMSRDPNQFKYESPTFSGVRFAVSTSTSNDNSLESEAYALHYSAGPLSAGIGQGSIKGTDGFEIENSAFGVRYNLGFATIDAAYQKADLTATTTAKIAGIGAIIPVSSAINLHLNYQSIDHTTITSDSKTAGVMGVYSLSKRTRVFAGYEAANNGSTTADTNVTSIGINHSF